MNGWRRLWVVCCMALILPPVYVYYEYIPSDEKLNRDHQKRIDEQLDAIKIIQEPVQGSNRLVRDVLMQTPVSERLATIEKDNAQHAEFMVKVGKQRPFTIARLAGAWIAACGLLYLLGSGIAWGVRGFARKSSV